MKEVKKVFYRCDKCGCEYSTKKDTKSCESKAITYDRGVKVGDKVRITSGDGSGRTAKVTRVYVIDKYWGHYAWQRYWHTIALSADLSDKGQYDGTRMLTYDSYEVIVKE